jgi:dTMP kinase
MDGMLIVIEGVDGSGKSTVSKEMARRLGVDWQCFPDRSTPIGKAIDGYLKGEWRVRGPEPVCFSDPLQNALVLQGLMFANRLEHLDRLRQSPHRSLVLDRYWQSGFAYGKYDGLDGAWLIQASQGLPQASLNVLLDTSPETSAERMKGRGAPTEHYDNIGALESLRRNYHEVWDWGMRHQGRDHWVSVDASGSKAETAEAVWALLLDKGCRKP